MPERAKMRPDDGDGFREAWAILERLWDGTVARARTFPEEALHRSVDDEWSFIQTLRHLNFASAAWVGRMVLGNPSPVAPARPAVGRGARLGRHPVGPRGAAVARRGARRTPRPPGDGRAASSRRSPTSSSRPTVTRTEPGWPQVEDFPLKQCLRIVLNEEWEHRLYAERDLTALANGS